MTKRASGLILFLTMGAICMSNGPGYAEDFEYAQYSSKDPALGIVIDYISGWSYGEHKGDGRNYDAGVIFIEDKKDMALKAFISVSVQDSARTGLAEATARAMADDIAARRLASKDAKVLSRSVMTLLGEEAQDMLFANAALDKLYSPQAQLIPVKERLVVFKKADKFYILRYQNREEEFGKFEKAFSRIIQSLGIKQDK